jgi:predicted O-linked N-acetylglucosamine transferase (SPINDLY family)
MSISVQTQAGLPVLTRRGGTFAGRLAASLLTSMGLTELIASTQEHYEELAVELATDPHRLPGIRRKLADHRLTAPLFDTKTFTKHLETAFAKMHARHRSGLPPAHVFS